jgi:hypothetical protein
LRDEEAGEALQGWGRVLGVQKPVRLDRILHTQVTNERGRLGCSLVGVVCDADAARIYHTRSLTAEDIVHELLHVAWPTWDEDQVTQETERLLRRVASGEPAVSGSRFP